MLRCCCKCAIEEGGLVCHICWCALIQPGQMCDLHELLKLVGTIAGLVESQTGVMPGHHLDAMLRQQLKCSPDVANGVALQSLPHLLSRSKRTAMAAEIYSGLT